MVASRKVAPLIDFFFFFLFSFFFKLSALEVSRTKREEAAERLAAADANSSALLAGGAGVRIFSGKGRTIKRFGKK
jgi:hypothetical protein